MATKKKLGSSVVKQLGGAGANHPTTTPPNHHTIHVPQRPVVIDAAHCWMERTNPLVGVSIRTAQGIFDAARAGDTQRLHWLFQEIEAANPLLFTCIDRRQSAIAGFQVKVSALPSMEGSLADEQKDAVESFISGIENFTEMLEHLDTAFFRGFALAQPIWEEDGSVREVRLHNSWEFLVHDGVLYHNPECNGFTRAAVPCADAGLVGIQRHRAIDYPALAIHIRHAVSERDWGRFLERYALPKPAVVMAANATNAQRDDYLVAAKAVENGQVSVWPNGSNITDFAGGSRGTDPFNSFIEHQEKLVVLLATGGTLTSLAQSDTGSLAGGAQMEVWKEIVRRDAGVLAQAVLRSLVKPFLAAKFGAQPCAVDLALDFPTERSAKEAAEIAATLKNAGWRVNQGELEKAVGFTLEKEESAPQIQAFARAKAKTAFKTDENGFKNAPRNPDGQEEGSGEDALVEALSGLFEKSLAEAAAEAVEDEEDLAAASDGEQPRGKTTPDSTPGSFAPKGTPREHRDKGFQDSYGNGNPETLASNPEKNVERGKAVISHIMGKKSGFEPHAMYRKDVGWIGVDYGTPGSGKNYDGGHGISHVVAKHPGAIDGVVDIMQNGTAYKHDASRRKVYLIKDRTAVVLSKDRENRLLITDFENLSDTQLREYTSKGKYHAKGENE